MSSILRDFELLKDLDNKITSIINGDQVVDSAIRDGDGNVINETYARKGDLMTDLPIKRGNGIGSLVMNVSESDGTEASGDYSIVTGYETQATGMAASANGNNTFASEDSQFVVGTYNEYDPDKMEVDDALFVVGNGTSSKRSNALEIGRDNATMYTRTHFTEGIDIDSVVRYTRNSDGNNITIPLNNNGYLCLLRAWGNGNMSTDTMYSNTESTTLLFIPPRDVVVDAKGTDLTIGTLTTLWRGDSSTGSYRVYLHHDSEMVNTALLHINDDDTGNAITLHSVTVFPIGFAMPRYEYPVG